SGGTGTEACDTSAGGCPAGKALDCNDDIVCTADTCDPQDGCAHGAVTGCCRTDADCDDHDACDGRETCDRATGICHAGATLDCNDADGGTTDNRGAAAGRRDTPLSSDHVHAS